MAELAAVIHNMWKTMWMLEAIDDGNHGFG